MNLKRSIWQPCNSKYDTPVDCMFSEISSINFSAQNMGLHLFCYQYNHFLEKKLKKGVSGNPVVENIAALCVANVVGFLKYCLSISQPKIWGFIKFYVSF